MSFAIKKDRASRILSQFPKKKVLVFGDVGLDQYTYGKVSRISPEAPIPVVEVTSTQFKLGLASNVADNVSALGGKPLLVGVIGKDRAGDEFLSILSDLKISNQHMVIDERRRTTLKERVVAETQQVVRIDYETLDRCDMELSTGIWKKLQKAIAASDIIIIEDYAKGIVSPGLCKQIIEVAGEKKIPVLIDPNRNTPVSNYVGCSLMTPNTTEAEALSGVSIVDSDSLNRAGGRLLDETGAQHIIITRGKDGMAIFKRGKSRPHLIPTFAREVFDVSGAGDTVIATLALSLVSGADMLEATLIANFAAGIEVGKRGTATVTVGEIKQYMDSLQKSRKN